MDFLKKHGEKVLFVVLLIVLAVTVFLAMNARSNFQRDVQRSPNAGKVEMTLDTAQVDVLIDQLKGDVPQLTVVTNTFTPAVRVICMNPLDQTLIPKDAKICPYCGYVQTERKRDTDGDGIDDDQELIWGMNPNDPNDVFLDPDKDGFTTLVEFQQGTDPTDPLSYPPLINYLRLKDVVQSSVEFSLKGIAKLGEVHTLQLYWKYPDQNRGETQYIKEGESFGRNKEFKIESYTEKRPLIDGKYIDQSEAVIQAGRQKLVLAREGDGRKGKITESTATLYLIMGPAWEQEVRVNKTFELDKKSYIVVDINSQSVVIKLNVDEPKAVDSITIKKATQAELDALKPPEKETNIDFYEGDIPMGIPMYPPEIH